MAALADALGPSFGLSEAQQLQLHFGGLLHDIGKLRLDPALLREEGGFSDEQRLQVQQHVVLGVQLVAPLSLWPQTLEIIHAHHERWDGRGYPRALAGDARGCHFFSSATPSSGRGSTSGAGGAPPGPCR